MAFPKVGEFAGGLVVNGMFAFRSRLRKSSADTSSAICARDTTCRHGESARAAVKNPQREPTAKQKHDAESSYLKGVYAMDKGNARAAEKAFARAAQKDPADHEYDADRQIAREFAITRMVQEADKARLLGHLDVARARLSGALALDPQNPVVSQHVEDLARLSAGGAACPGCNVHDRTPN